MTSNELNGEKHKPLDNKYLNWFEKYENQQNGMENQSLIYSMINSMILIFI